MRVYQFRHQRAAAIVAALTPSAGLSTLLSNTCSKRRREGTTAWRSTAGSRRSGTSSSSTSTARLSADRARDRRGGRARLAVDRARAPREPRARGPAAPRPDQAAGARARRASAVRSRAPAGGDVHRLPLVGEIAAGGPLLAEQNVEDYLAVPEPLSRGGEEFLLRVKGDSMIQAGILDGDIVVVRRQADARDGEIVVALAGDDESADEATVKRFFREGGRIRLQPENDALEPIYARPRADPRARSPACSGWCDGASSRFNRTLEQELLALAARREPRVPRLRRVPAAARRCARLSRVRLGSAREGAMRREAQVTIRRAGRVTAGRSAGSRKVRTPTGQDAGEIPGGESRRKVAQKGDRRRRTSSPETPAVRVKGWGKSPPAPW